uniref:Uncharacterized protein n=1 Tax=Arundo donax TaxID=35708 RepID=A0A0A9H477_ARUDO
MEELCEKEINMTKI